MSQIDQKIAEAFDNLPDQYASTVKKFPVAEKVGEIARAHQIRNRDLDNFDKEVTYLVLHITDAVEFITRIENKLELGEAEAAHLAQAVTDKIIKPIYNQVPTADEGAPPPPPAPTPPGETPQTGYGGQSDPYREPAG